MVKSTFIKLPPAKKELITAALLREFSNYPLQKAQVARIVKDAGIARGSFYKYFTDLSDAYEYLYRQAIAEIHAFIKLPSAYEPQSFYQNVVDFVEQTLCGQYSKLVKMHVLYNESLVVRPFSSKVFVKLSTQNWSAMVLCHAAIKEIIVDPQLKKPVLAHLKAGLMLLTKETK